MDSHWNLVVGDHVRVTPNRSDLGPANGVVTAIRDEGFDVLLEAARVNGVRRSSARTDVMPPGVLVGPVRWEDVGTIERSAPSPFVRRYFGKRGRTTEAFQQEAVLLASAGYTPGTPVYSGGAWSTGAWIGGILALLLFFFGIIVLIYMIAMPPDGELTVTYQPRDESVGSTAAVINGSHTMDCPRCAETIKRAATMCRYCGLDLQTGS